MHGITHLVRQLNFNRIQNIHKRYYTYAKSLGNRFTSRVQLQENRIDTETVLGDLISPKTRAKNITVTYYNL